MPKPKNILLIDGNNALARFTHKYPEAENAAGEPIGGIYGLVQEVQTQVTRHQYDVVVAAFDDGVPDWRKQLAPHYKGHREAARKPEQEEIHKKYKAQQPVAWRALVPAGIHTCRVPGCEGDDALAVLAMKRFADHCVTILSSDKDFTALATSDGRVSVFDSISGTPRNPDDTYMLKRCLDPKVSDNLDGATGVGPKKADLIVDTWRSETGWDVPMDQSATLEAFLNWCGEKAAEGSPVGKIAAKVVDWQQNVRVNFKVTNLHESSRQYETALKWRKGKPDRTAFKQVLKDLNLAPLYSNFSTVWSTFARLGPLP